MGFVVLANAFYAAGAGGAGGRGVNGGGSRAALEDFLF